MGISVPKIYLRMQDIVIIKDGSVVKIQKYTHNSYIIPTLLVFVLHLKPVVMYQISILIYVFKREFQ